MAPAQLEVEEYENELALLHDWLVIYETERELAGVQAAQQQQQQQQSPPLAPTQEQDFGREM